MITHEEKELLIAASNDCFLVPAFSLDRGMKKSLNWNYVEKGEAK
tara:strand:- start:265 stop:399 length:135 start_codon:yes stop_codon:yes gene_type:complete